MGTNAPSIPPTGKKTGRTKTKTKTNKDGTLLVNWVYFCAIMMVHSGYLSLEKILPPQVVFESLGGTEGTDSPPHR